MTKYRNENYNRETDDWYQTFEMVAQLNWEDFQIYINENNERFLKKCVEIVLKGKTKFRGKIYTDGKKLLLKKQNMLQNLLNY